jgi:hypothetical protein
VNERDISDISWSGVELFDWYRFGALRLSPFDLVFPLGSLESLYSHFFSARFSRHSLAMQTPEKKNRSCASPSNSRFGVLRLSPVCLVFPSGSLEFLYNHFFSARFTRHSPGIPRPAKKNRSCASPSNLRPKRRIWFSSICPEAIHNFPFPPFSDTLSCATSARRPKPQSHYL